MLFAANEVLWSHIFIAHILDYGGPLASLLVYSVQEVAERPGLAPHSGPGVGLDTETMHLEKDSPEQTLRSTCTCWLHTVGSFLTPEKKEALLAVLVDIFIFFLR